MQTGTSTDLAWWRERRDADDIDPVALRRVLDRLTAWRVQHDADRARQPSPFFKMIWDGVFGDEAHEVAEAARQIEDALGRRTAS